MFKKWKILLSFALLQIFFLPMYVSNAMDLSSLFEGIDFDQLAKDMESMLEDIEKQDSNKESTPEKSIADFPEREPSLKRAEDPDESASVDIKTLFLEPIKIESSSRDDKKGSYRFSKAKLNAYDHYMNLLVDHLTTIEKKIDASKIFSPEFKTHFTQDKSTIDEVVVSDALISTKKMYKRVFFLSNFSELRKKIVAAVEKLEAIDKRIAFDLTQEEKVTDNLKKRAEGPAFKSQVTPLELPQYGHRGKKSAVKTTREKLPTSKRPAYRTLSYHPSKHDKLEKDLKTLFAKDISEISKTLSSVRTTKESEAEIQKKVKKREQQIQAARQRAAQKFSGGGFGSSGYRRPSGYRSSDPSSSWGPSSPWGGSGAGRGWGGGGPSRWGQANPWDPTGSTNNPSKKSDADAKNNEKDMKNPETEGFGKTGKASKETKDLQKAKNHIEALLALMKKTSPSEVVANLEDVAQHISKMNAILSEVEPKKNKEFKETLKKAYENYYPKILNALETLTIAGSGGGLMFKSGIYESALRTIYNECTSAIQSSTMKSKAASCAKEYAARKELEANKRNQGKNELESIKKQAETMKSLLPYGSPEISALIEKINQLLQSVEQTVQPTYQQQASVSETASPRSQNAPHRRIRRRPAAHQDLATLKRNLTRQRDTTTRYFNNYIENVATAENANDAPISGRQIKAKTETLKHVEHLKARAEKAFNNAQRATDIAEFNNYIKNTEELKNEAQEAVETLYEMFD